MAFEYHMMIREQHLDTFGHVNNATYLILFEEARWEITTQAGYGIEKVREIGQGPIILEIQLKFIRELKLRSRIIIKSQAEPFAGKISILKQWILDEAGNICCEAEFKMGFFDLRSRKLILPTHAWLHAVGLVASP